MWLATAMSKAASGNGSAWTSQVRASASSMLAIEVTVWTAVASMPSERSVKVSRRSGRSGATLAQRAPVPHPTSSTAAATGQLIRPTNQGYQGSSARV